jgi:hypothetical protein
MVTRADAKLLFLRLMQPQRISCPICQSDQCTYFNDGKRNTHLSCPSCGDFMMTWDLGLEFEATPKELRPYLSAATRQAHEEGKPLTLDTKNWREFAAAQRAISVSAKIERILRIIGQRAALPGGICGIDPDRDHPLFSATSRKELAVYLEHLQDEGLLDGPKASAKGLPISGNYAPTIKGWQRLEPVLSPGGEPDRCFVAMWFADELDSAYQLGFAKAIEECGFKPYRVKEDPTHKAIIDRILSEIRRAHFVVADFTGHRQSVYYEAGFARGIGREVIGCCREGETKGLAFDTRHLGHIVWADADDLRRKLTDSIQANILPKT